MFSMNRQSRLSFLSLVASAAFSGFAGPVTTVPWNGHTGAVSFTYDDARSSQIPNLLPQLDSLKIKATFFIAVNGTGGDFSSRVPDWIQVAQKGYELANHTYNHVNVPADPDAAAIVSQMATYLRGLDTSIQSVTFAYPNCNVNGEAGVGAENFSARGCGETSYAWNTQPSDWLNIQGLILTPTSVQTGISLLGTAKSKNAWVTTIVHDVTANPDAYSLTPPDNLKMLEAGVADSLWIDTYADIAAYYRAHFTMDTVTAKTSSSGGWTMTWVSPHPKMPKSVMLRVKLNATTFGSNFVVEQKGTAIPPAADGSYTIDFMQLSLSILPKTTGVLARAPLPFRLVARATPDGITFDGVIGDVQATVADIEGHRLFCGRVSNGFIPLRNDWLQGLLFLTLTKPATGSSVHALINATH